MTRTELTAEQYSELVVALEQLRAEYINGCDYRVERTLRVHWLTLRLSPFAFIYLIQWFNVIEQPCRIDLSRQHILDAIDHMVAELCEERCQ